MRIRPFQVDKLRVINLLDISFNPLHKIKLLHLKNMDDALPKMIIEKIIPPDAVLIEFYCEDEFHHYVSYLNRLPEDNPYKRGTFKICSSRYGVTVAKSKIKDLNMLVLNNPQRTFAHARDPLYKTAMRHFGAEIRAIEQGFRKD